MIRYLTIAALLAIGGTPASASPVATPPLTIPALQEWTAGAGRFTLDATSRVVVDPAHIGVLGRTAGMLAAELRELTGLPMRLSVWPPAQRGDIYLVLGPTELGDEGYRLDTQAMLTVTGQAGVGVFYGTRTLTQWFRQSLSVPAGTARDWPVKPERGLMVDVGRKFFDISWLRARVRDMAYTKLNLLHLHLSDNLGFRLESTSHPEVVSAQHYTKREIAELIEYAASHHVRIVPEIDAPGHMDQILRVHPELKLVRDDGFVNDGFIDLAKPAAYRLILELVTEYLPLFPGEYWHIGADEYVSGGSGSGSYDRYPQLLQFARQHYGPNATAKDTFYGYVNWINNIVRAHGKTARMWNDDIRHDGATIRPDPNIVVEHWYQRANPSALTPQELADAGHTVLNGHYTQTYYVLGSKRKPDLRSMYEDWHPDLFHRTSTLAPTATNRGAKVHVWADRPATETPDEVATHIRAPLRVLAQHTWGSSKVAVTWPDFRSVVDVIGDAPNQRGNGIQLPLIPAG